MADEEDTTKHGSVVKDLLAVGKDNIGPLVDYGKQEILVSMFQAEAARLTIWGSILNVANVRQQVVCSPQVRSLMKAYQFYGSDDDGVVLVGFGPQDSGKSMAAEFLLHGDHNFRPVRGLKLTAAGMGDFAKGFREKYSVSLVVRKATGLTAQSLNWAVRRNGFDKESPIELYITEFSFPANLPVKSFARTPVIIIDDFNTISKVNRKFVTELFTRATRSNIIVVIFTKVKEWATELVQLNSAMKIVPIRSNINNSWKLCDPFEGKPEWSDLPWEVKCLHDLVRPYCDEVGLSAESLITEPMLPKSAKRLVKLAAYGGILD
eukprot:scaffold46095_cov70-Attheya_sp.AAC.11